MDEAFCGYYGSSSPDGQPHRRLPRTSSPRGTAARISANSSSPSASSSPTLVRDSIDYIQKLYEQERQIQAEIKKLESDGGSGRGKSSSIKKGINHMEQ
ncbi:hypothetical protein LINPERHAP1_LOCUS30231 [Linum perenne]